MKNFLFFGLGLCATLSVSAVPLNPDSSVPLPERLGPVLGIFVDTEIGFFSEGSPPNNLTGSVFSSVISNDPSNPYSGLTFVYEVLNLSLLITIGEFSVSGFDQFQVDASFAPPGDGPALANRSADGDVITFDFGTEPLGVSALSGLLVLQTSALDYTEVSATVGNGIQDTVRILAPLPPSSPVPDAGSTGLLFGLALVGFGAFFLKANRA